MMFRQICSSYDNQWRTLDRLSRLELELLRVDFASGRVENVSGGDAVDQALVQVEILLEAPAECLFSQ